MQTVKINFSIIGSSDRFKRKQSGPDYKKKPFYRDVLQFDDAGSITDISSEKIF